jgi:integrase
MVDINDTTFRPSKRKVAANKVAFTDRYLQSLKPKDGKGLISRDAHTANFGIRVTDRGVKSFLVIARRKGERKPTKITLGRYVPRAESPTVTVAMKKEPRQVRLGDDLTLAEARELANDVRRDLRRGINPREEQKRQLEEQRAEERRMAEHSFKAAAERYIAEHSRLKSAHYTALVIRKDLIPRWGPLSVASITRKHVTAMLHDIKADVSRRRNPGGTSYSARKALSAASGLFGWGIATDLYGLEYNPCTGISAKRLIGEKVARSRTFSDDELRLFSEVTSNMEYPWGPLARMLLLSAGRLREIAHARWDEIDSRNSMLVIPAARMKGGKEHSVPITAAMQSIIDELPGFQGGKFLFSMSGGKRPAGGFGNFVDLLREEMLIAHRRKLGVPELDANLRQHLDLAGDEQIPSEYCIPHFVLHDIRRTARSLLGRAGVSSEVSERCLAHVPGGVEGVYDRWSYLPERRAALERLAVLIACITNPADNVVQLRAAE